MITGTEVMFIVVCALVIDAVLALGLHLGWPEKIQRRTNGSGHIWLLLDIAGLPRIEENCTALATGYFIAGIIVSTLAALAAYLFVFRDNVFAYLS